MALAPSAGAAEGAMARTSYEGSSAPHNSLTGPAASRSLAVRAMDPAANDPPRRRRMPAPTLPVLLLLLLGAVNALAIAGVVSARRSAREAALQDLRLQTEGHARALEAVLAGLRRDLLALVRTPALHALLVESGGEPAAAAAARAEAERAVVAFALGIAALRAAALRANRGAPSGR